MFWCFESTHPLLRQTNWWHYVTRLLTTRNWEESPHNINSWQTQAINGQLCGLFECYTHFPTIYNLSLPNVCFFLLNVCFSIQLMEVLCDEMQRCVVFIIQTVHINCNKTNTTLPLNQLSQQQLRMHPWLWAGVSFTKFLLWLFRQNKLNIRFTPYINKYLFHKNSHICT